MTTTESRATTQCLATTQRLIAANGRLKESIERILSRTEITRLDYHNLEHSLDVAATACAFAKSEGLDKRTQCLLEAAGYVHDTGYLLQYEHNEIWGARIARRLLPRLGYTRAEARTIALLVLATDLRRTPESVEEKVLRDADLRNLGDIDFVQKNEALCREIGMAQDRRWYEGSLRFLESQRYLTATAARLLESGKAAHAQELRQMLDHADESDALVSCRAKVAA